MHKCSKLIYPVTVTVRIGDPIETSTATLEQRDEIIATTRASIQALLEAPTLNS